MSYHYTPNFYGPNIYGPMGYGYPDCYPRPDYYRDSSPSSTIPPSASSANYQNESQTANIMATVSDIPRVPGPKAIHDHVLQPGQKIIAFDANNPILYIKEADNLGATTSAYNLTEIDFMAILNAENGGAPVRLTVSREELDVLRNQISELAERLNRMDQNSNRNKQIFNKNNKEEAK